MKADSLPHVEHITHSHTLAHTPPSHRFELVTGRAEPTDAELKGYSGGHQGGGGAQAGTGKGIPCFWLNALCADVGRVCGEMGMWDVDAGWGLWVGQASSI